jgi:hypothetical protein
MFLEGAPVGSHHRSEMNDDEGEERRAGSRLRVQLPLQFAVLGYDDPVEGLLIDLSEVGCSLRAAVDVRAGASVSVIVRQEGADVCTAAGRVQRCLGGVIAVRFDVVSPALRRFVRQLRQVGWPTRARLLAGVGSTEVYVL